MRIRKLAAIAVLSLLALTGCTKVPSGHVGVKVYLLGSDKGADIEELGMGRYFIGMNEELHLFPTFVQNYTWTQRSTNGSENDESMTFQTKEGMTVGADIGISYAVDPTKVSDIFQRYRKGIEEITDLYLRNMVRDALVEAGSKREVEDVYGSGKGELMDEVEATVIEQVGPIGINVEKIYWIGGLRLPPTVTAALDAKIEATQMAEQRKNEVAQATAEADKEIEAARGTAESLLEVARAEAEAIRIKGEALRQNPSVIQLNAVEKWDGVLPKMTGSEAIPFVSVDIDKS